MIKLLTPTPQVLDFDKYCFERMYDGLDECQFTLPAGHAQLSALYEELQIEASEDGQRYLVKSLDEGAQTLNVRAYLDLDELKASMRFDYTNNSNTLAATIRGILPAGWTVVDRALLTTRKTVKLEAGTPFEIIQECGKKWSVTFRYNNAARQVIIENPDQNQPIGAFVSKELNLREVNFQGKSTDFATRLYARGKEGMTFAAINGGRDYVDDHTYSSKIICRYWKDERYTDPQSLLDDTKRNLKAMAVPKQSYVCDVIDLKSMDETYNFQDLSLYNRIHLLDIDRDIRVLHMVVQVREYPNYPDENIITLSTVPGKITTQIKQIQTQIEEPTSDFRQKLQVEINIAGEKILGVLDGNFIFTYGTNGQQNGFMLMDTADPATAKNVIRANYQGFSFSENGVNGPFSAAIGINGRFLGQGFKGGTFDAAIINTINLNAGNISAGTMSADYISGGSIDATNVNITNLDAESIVAGILKSVDGLTWFNLDQSEIKLGTDPGNSLVFRPGDDIMIFSNGDASFPKAWLHRSGETAQLEFYEQNGSNGHRRRLLLNNDGLWVYPRNTANPILIGADDQGNPRISFDDDNWWGLSSDGDVALKADRVIVAQDDLWWGGRKIIETNVTANDGRVFHALGYYP